MLKIINRYILFLIVPFTICSCEKEEIPILPHTSGDVITSSVKMEGDYRYQLYFDLETNSTVKQQHKTEWDLGFETSVDGFNIILNTSKLMYAANTQQSNFSEITDTEGLSFKWDEASGNMDSTAIGNWTDNQYVYVVDRGYDEKGVHQGFKKVIFQSVDNNEYQIHCANLDGSNDLFYQVLKDQNYTFTFFSLDGRTVNIHPPKEDWDISFTQYTHVFYDEGNPPIPYLVTGAITNRNKVEVAQVFDKGFQEISFEDINTYSFSNQINKIGFDWKTYNFDLAIFDVLLDKNYIVKSTEGKFYKLHFIDFYDQNGVKGTPTFEFQEL